MVGGALERHRMMQTRTSLVIAKDSGKEEKTPLLHSRCSAMLVCLDITQFVRDGMTGGCLSRRFVEAPGCVPSDRGERMWARHSLTSPTFLTCQLQKKSGVTAPCARDSGLNGNSQNHSGGAGVAFK